MLKITDSTKVYVLIIAAATIAGVSIWAWISGDVDRQIETIKTYSAIREKTIYQPIVLELHNYIKDIRNNVTLSPGASKEYTGLIWLYPKCDKPLCKHIPENITLNTQIRQQDNSYCYQITIVAEPGINYLHKYDKSGLITKDIKYSKYSRPRYFIAGCK